MSNYRFIFCLTLLSVVIETRAFWHDLCPFGQWCAQLPCKCETWLKCFILSVLHQIDLKTHFDNHTFRVYVCITGKKKARKELQSELDSSVRPFCKYLIASCIVRGKWTSERTATAKQTYGLISSSSVVNMKNSLSTSSFVHIHHLSWFVSLSLDYV